MSSTIRTKDSGPKKDIRKRTENQKKVWYDKNKIVTVGIPYHQKVEPKKKFETLREITDNALKAGKAKRLSFKAGIEEGNKQILSDFGRKYILDEVRLILGDSIAYKGNRVKHLRTEDVKAALRSRGHHYYGTPKKKKSTISKKKTEVDH